MSEPKELNDGTEMQRDRTTRRLDLVDYIAPMPNLADAERALANLIGASNVEDITNRMDEMQKLHFKNQRAKLATISSYLIDHKQMIREENVEKFMKMIDECVRYLRWTDDSPFDEDDYILFVGFIDMVIRNVWPREFGDDEKTVTTWKKLVNHTLSGDLMTYLDDVWCKVELTLRKLEATDQQAEYAWEKMTNEERLCVDRFKWLVHLISICTEEQLTPEMCSKISGRVIPYIFNFLESILVQGLAAESAHPQIKLVLDMFCFLSNFVPVIQGETFKSIRQRCGEICKEFLNQPKTTVNFLCFYLKAFCYTIQELKRKRPAEMKILEEECTVLNNKLWESMNNGPVSAGHITFEFHELINATYRFLLIHDNQQRLLEFRFEDKPDTGLIDSLLKGVDSADKRAQTASLECLKVIAEDESFIQLLKANKNCLLVLKDIRKSPHMSVRKKAVDVMMTIMIERPSELKVTRKRLERSNCIRWSEGDVREKMIECGLVLQPDIDTTGWDGEWLVELLDIRREDKMTYLNIVESQFQIKPDRSRLEFNLAMRKLEKMVLSEDLTHDPNPYQSLN